MHPQEVIVKRMVVEIEEIPDENEPKACKVKVGQTCFNRTHVKPDSPYANGVMGKATTSRKRLGSPTRKDRCIIGPHQKPRQNLQPAETSPALPRKQSLPARIGSVVVVFVFFRGGDLILGKLVTY